MSKQLHILLIAHEHAPYHRPASTVGSQRTYNFMKYLTKLGYRVSVVCSDFKSRRTLQKNQLAEVIKNLDQYTHSSAEGTVYAIPSLVHDGFWDYTWSKTVVLNDNGSYSRAPDLIRRSIGKVATFFKQLISGDYSSAWAQPAFMVAEHIHKNDPVYFMLAEHGPDCSIYVARKIHKRYNIPWGVDYRDYIMMPFYGALHALYKIRHKQLISSASLFINVTEGWSSSFERMFGYPSVTITNGYDELDFQHKKEISFEDKIIISHIGSISEKTQDLPLFFKGLKMFYESYPEYENKLIFMYAGTSYDFVTRAAHQCNVESHCLIHGFIPREKAISMMHSSSALLLLSSKQNVMYYSNCWIPAKFFEYIRLGKPIITVPKDFGDLENALIASSVQPSVSEPAEIADLIKKICDNPAAITYQYDMYSREQLTLKLAGCIQSVVLKESTLNE